jgi:hypothetical protein
MLLSKSRKGDAVPTRGSNLKHAEIRDFGSGSPCGQTPDLSGTSPPRYGPTEPTDTRSLRTKTTFQPILLIRETVIIGRRVLLGEAIDVIARRGQPSQQILVPDLPEEHPVSIHPLRWNQATISIPPGLRSLEVHRHGNHHLGVVRWIETNLTLSHILMPKRRHASMKSTAGLPDVRRLTRVTANGIGTTFHTLVTGRHYVRP